MELRPVNIPLLDDGSKGISIGGLANRFMRDIAGHTIGVGEIVALIRRDIFKQNAVLLRGHFVPSHMRDAQGSLLPRKREPLRAAVNPAESFGVTFLTVLGQELHPQTDAEYR